MKEKILKNNNVKFKLNKKQQTKMLDFFAKTSIPRMIQANNKEVK